MSCWFCDIWPPRAHSHALFSEKALSLHMPHHPRELQPTTSTMVTLSSYQRIYTWHQLNQDDLYKAPVEPQVTRTVMTQLAELAKHDCAINHTLPEHFILSLRHYREERRAVMETFSDPDNRLLFLSDLYDYLQLIKYTDR